MSQAAVPLDAKLPRVRNGLHPAVLEDLSATGPGHESYRLRHADGGYRWLLATGVPKYGRDGSFTGYVGCDIDITERKNAEDRIRASQAALEASHQLIVKGQRMREIASNLGLSTRTVEGHKYEMMETLGVTSTAELARYALDRRLKVD